MLLVWRKGDTVLRVGARVQEEKERDGAMMSQLLDRPARLPPQIPTFFCSH